MASSCFVGSMFAQEESGNYAVGTTIGGTAKDVCRFSFALKGGVDYLRLSDQNVNPQFGGLVEITVNPLWGLGLEYMYLMNDHDATNYSGGYDLESTVQDITLFGSVNISNIIAKYRSNGWQKWNLYGNIGAGVSIYDWNLKDTDEEDNGVKPVGVVGMLFEYNVAKWLALGLEGQYRMHSDATFVGHNAGSGGMFGANFSARFKFCGDRNVRNMALVNYEPKEKITDAEAIAAASQKQYAELTEQLENKLAGQNAAIQKLQNQVKETQDTVNALKERLKTPVKYIPTTEETAIIKTAFSQLEFESAKDVIKPSSYSSLDGLATLLKQHPEWTVELKGYTDSSGNAEKNLQLSKDRANAVKTYLVNKGVSASTIKSSGFGAADPIATNSTAAGRAQNRRVEIELFSK